MKKYFLFSLLFISTLLQAQSDLLNNIVGYWNFDQTSGALADSVNGNDAVATGATLNQTGKLGKAVAYNGTDQYLTTVDDLPLQFAYSNLTFSAWIKITAYPSTGNHYAIIGSQVNGAVLLINDAGHIRLGMNNVAEAGLSTGTIALDTWTFVAACYDQTADLITYYVNTTTNQSSWTREFGDGAASMYFGTYATQYDFSGLIDEVGMWKAVLSSTLIAELYNSGDGLTYPFSVEAEPSTLLTGIAAYWKIDETSGTNINDEVSTNDGSLTSGTINQTGILGKCVLFAGNVYSGGQYITFPDNLTMSMYGTDWSWSFWLKPGTLTIDQWFLAAETGGLDISLKSNGTLCIIQHNTAEGTPSTKTVSTGSWHHVVITFNNSTNKLNYYIDNQTPDEVDFTYNFTSGSSSRYLGSIEGGDAYDGYIDEVGLWTRVLTPTEVSELYNSGAGISHPFSVEPEPPVVTPIGREILMPGGNTKSVLLSGIKRNYLLPTTGPEQPPYLDYTTYVQWNFNNEFIDGSYTSVDINADFPVYAIENVGVTSIVEQELNGALTKAVKTTMLANSVWEGLQLHSYYHADHSGYDEVYMTYNIKFDTAWQWVGTGKLPGIRGTPFTSDPRLPTDGFYAAPCFKQGGRLIDYYYDWTKSWVPWSTWDETNSYLYDSIYFQNGNWYNITQRVVSNTFTGSTPNADGINEIWVDGRLIYQRDDIKWYGGTGHVIDGFFLGAYTGGSGTFNMPSEDTYVYFDNVVIWKPNSDPTYGARTTHSTSSVLPTPAEITDRDVYYEELINTEGTLTNSEYGGTYSILLEETWLIDAGSGNTVNLTLDTYGMAANDFILIYDGNQTDSRFLDIVTNQSGTSRTSNSTGRYMFVRFVTDRETGSTGFTGTITFEENFVIYNEWNFNDAALGDYSTAISNDFDVLEMYWEENTDIVYDTIDGVRSKALKITQAAGVMDQGLQLDAALGADYNEVYMTYNIKFGSNWAWLEGKLPGLEGRPFPVINYPAEPDEGYIAIKLFKEGGKMTTFNYDHSYECSWGACGTEDYNTGNAVYFMNNVWYEVTQRMVMNTFTGGTPNDDGINEIWINGVKIFEESPTSLPESSSDKSYFEQQLGGIDAIALAMFYSNSGSEPNAQTYSIIDNIKIYTPNNDATLGTHNVHDDADTLITPSGIADQTIIYDDLITAEGTLSNSEYGSNYSNEIEEVYLIDAGAGNTVTYTFTGGNVTGDDFVIIRDGNQSTSEVLYRVNNANPTGSFESSGRYLSIQFTTQGNAVSTGWTGTVAFN